MLGEIVELRKDILMCRGEYPDNIIFHPIVRNCYVVRDGKHLFIIDSGAGPVMKKSIKKAVEKLRGETENLVLINTHMHVDHIANNDLITELEGFKQKHHLVHEAGKPGFNTFNHLLNLHEQIDRYYDVFEGPPPPWRTFLRFLEIGNRKKALEQLVKWGVRKFEPMRPSPDTATFLEDSSAEEIELGSLSVESVAGDHTVSINLEPLKMKGWRFNGAVIINDGAHSPDHTIVYFPEKKVLFTGDLTLELFPTWPGESSGNKNLEYLHLCLEMAEEGLIELLADSHHREPPADRVKIAGFLRELMNTNKAFKTILLEQIRYGEKFTVNDVYRSLRKLRFENELVNRFLDFQFPKTPVFLKTIITNMLVEEGCIIEGSGKTATFTLPG